MSDDWQFIIESGTVLKKNVKRICGNKQITQGRDLHVKRCNGAFWKPVFPVEAFGNTGHLFLMEMSDRQCQTCVPLSRIIQNLYHLSALGPVAFYKEVASNQKILLGLKLLNFCCLPLVYPFTPNLFSYMIILLHSSGSGCYLGFLKNSYLPFI